jgi:hypothetical protein
LRVTPDDAVLFDDVRRIEQRPITDEAVLLVELEQEVLDRLRRTIVDDVVVRVG